MGTRTISISDEAYAQLYTLKREKESFTDVIKRITKKRSLLEVFGIFSNDEAKELERTIEEGRKRSVARRRRLKSKVA